VFVAVGIQRAMRMRHIISPSVAYRALKHFSTLTHTPRDLKKKEKPLKTKMCVLIFSTTFV
jgi:hypothetical protein